MSYATVPAAVRLDMASHLTKCVTTDVWNDWCQGQADAREPHA
jgi:hypothetical protein